MTARHALDTANRAARYWPIVAIAAAIIAAVAWLTWTAALFNLAGALGIAAFALSVSRDMGGDRDAWIASGWLTLGAGVLGAIAGIGMAWWLG